MAAVLADATHVIVVVAGVSKYVGTTHTLEVQTVARRTEMPCAVDRSCTCGRARMTCVNSDHASHHQSSYHWPSHTSTLAGQPCREAAAGRRRRTNNQSPGSLVEHNTPHRRVYHRDAPSCHHDRSRNATDATNKPKSD